MKRIWGSGDRGDIVVHFNGDENGSEEGETVGEEEKMIIAAKNMRRTEELGSEQKKKISLRQKQEEFVL